jgi:hypothetical protein
MGPGRPPICHPSGLVFVFHTTHASEGLGGEVPVLFVYYESIKFCLSSERMGPASGDAPLFFSKNLR